MSETDDELLDRDDDKNDDEPLDLTSDVMMDEHEGADEKRVTINEPSRFLAQSRPAHAGGDHLRDLEL